MPLKPGAPVGQSIRELKTGSTYAQTAGKFGAKKAHKQSVAIALSNARKGKRTAWQRQPQRFSCMS